MTYRDTFIAVAEDTKATQGLVPKPRGGKETIPQIEYRLLIENPYKLDQPQLTFLTHLARTGVKVDSLSSRKRKLLWDALFSKGQPCLRASSLTKSNGWGAHFNEEGCICIYGMESAEYKAFQLQTDLKQLKAMRSSRK